MSDNSDEDFFDYEKDSPKRSAQNDDEGDPEVPLSTKTLFWRI